MLTQQHRSNKENILLGVAFQANFVFSRCYSSAYLPHHKCPESPSVINLEQNKDSLVKVNVSRWVSHLGPLSAPCDQAVGLHLATFQISSMNLSETNCCPCTDSLCGLNHLLVLSVILYQMTSPAPLQLFCPQLIVFHLNSVEKSSKFLL